MIQTDIPVLDEMFGKMYHYLPALPDVRLPVKVSQRGLNFQVPEDGAIKDWMDGLRSNFDMSDLKLWVLAPWEKKPKLGDVAVYKQAHFLPGGKSPREEVLDTTRKVGLYDASNELLLKASISSEIRLYYTGFTGVSKKSAQNEIGGNEVYYQFSSGSWLDWVSQYWEFEVLKLDDSLFLSDFYAGQNWSTYPLVDHFVKQLGENDYRVLFEMEMLEGSVDAFTADDLDGFYFLNDQKEVLGQADTFELLTHLEESGDPIKLGLFNADTDPEILTKITVSPASRVSIVWDEETDE
ncbi:MAG: hypothetical protein GYB31_08690 [Bacteroidetes bacterium]|nr:hypothetical protein [Bacteroidota bacterium]